MKAIKQNDVLDVVYDSWYGLPLEEADKVVSDYVHRKLIPIEWVEKQISITSDITNEEELDILYAGNLSYMLKLWKGDKEVKK